MGMSIRRFTRLTNGFRKKWEDQRAGSASGSLITTLPHSLQLARYSHNGNAYYRSRVGLSGITMRQELTQAFQNLSQ